MTTFYELGSGLFSLIFQQPPSGFATLTLIMLIKHFDS